MKHLVTAALNYVNARKGPRKLEVDRLRELEHAVALYKEAHQGTSSSDSSLATSSASMRAASSRQ